MVSTTVKVWSMSIKVSCDLLKNQYLCGINNSNSECITIVRTVVICSKINTFVVSTTVNGISVDYSDCCDLLKNQYLCGINNSVVDAVSFAEAVVICSKINTFVVSTTVKSILTTIVFSCDMLKNQYLCGINNSLCSYFQCLMLL